MLFRSIEAIKEEKISRIYFAGDGPRSEYDQQLIQECQRLILDNFPNIPRKNLRFNEQNQGCRIAVSSAIDWFFSHEEKGIILEDDCLPGPNFFNFLTESLKRFEYDMSIFSINATSPIVANDLKCDAHLSIYPQI